MSPPLTVSRLAAACKRYGPGRLPGADSPALGAGYAAATAALVVALGFAAGMAGLMALGSPFGLAAELWVLSALAAVPLVVPAAFVVAALVWRVLPESVPGFGVVAGGLAAFGTYLVAVGLVFGALLVSRVVHPEASLTGELLVETGMVSILIGVFGLVLSGPLAIPVGCASGAVYERARVVELPRTEAHAAP